MWQQFCKVERCRLSASLGLFVRDTKGLSMVAGEWRALTLASEGWPGLVSPQRAALQSWTTESCQFYFFSKTVLDEKSCSYILLILLLDENQLQDLLVEPCLINQQLSKSASWTQLSV